MDKPFDLGWLIVITEASRVYQLRLSVAMDTGAFARFEHGKSI